MSESGSEPNAEQIEAALKEAALLLERNREADAYTLLRSTLEECGYANTAENRSLRMAIANVYVLAPSHLRYTLAIAQEALREEPNNREALILLGTIYEHHGLHKRARAMFKRLETDPDPDPPKAAAIRLVS